ncbi:MAG: hypothetical protein WBA93_29145 [Microcoleaceae cyanobacterium]
MYLYTTNIENLEVKNNIFSDNKYFQIGCSGDYEKEDFQAKNINIEYNLIFNRDESITYPVYLEEWAKDYVYGMNGNNAVVGDPLFENAVIGDFSLQSSSPAINAGIPEQNYNDADSSRNDIGAIYDGKKQDFWWLTNFPPKIEA